MKNNLWIFSEIEMGINHWASFNHDKLVERSYAHFQIRIPLFNMFFPNLKPSNCFYTVMPTVHKCKRETIREIVISLIFNYIFNFSPPIFLKHSSSHTILLLCLKLKLDVFHLRESQSANFRFHRSPARD